MEQEVEDSGEVEESESIEASAARGEGLSLESGTVGRSGAEATIEDLEGDASHEEALAEGEQAMQDEEEEEVEVADEPQAVEGNQPNILRTPKSLTKQQREEHEATHATYQPWCRACVRARGKNRPHRRMNHDKRVNPGIKRVSMDYMFMSQEDKSSGRNPMIIMVDEETCAEA